MKIIIIVLSVFLLFSCSPSNVWQKAGLAKPEPIEFEMKIGDAESSEGKVDVFRSLNGSSNGAITFTIDKPDNWDGDVLYRQSQKAGEDMALAITARCYDKSDISTFLSSPIDNDDVVNAMKNTLLLIKSGEDSINKTIEGFLPVIDRTENEIADQVIDAYNKLREELNGAAEKIISQVFEPVYGLLQSSDNPTWGEYVRCQLSINLLGGILEAMEGTVKGVMSKESFNRLEEGDFDFSNREDITNLFQEVAVDSLLFVLNNVISSLLSPLSVYEKITSTYPEEVQLPSLAKIIEGLGGER